MGSDLVCFAFTPHTKVRTLFRKSGPEPCSYEKLGSGTFSENSSTNFLTISQSVYS